MPPKDIAPNVFAFIQDQRGAAWPRKYPDGVAVATVEDLRWQRCNIKTSMLLANMLAKRQADDAGAFEAILVSKDGTVHEGQSSNFFAVIGGSLRTHPADNHVLPGVTRNVVLDLARTHGIPAAERAFSKWNSSRRKKRSSPAPRRTCAPSSAWTASPSPPAASARSRRGSASCWRRRCNARRWTMDDRRWTMGAPSWPIVHRL